MNETQTRNEQIHRALRAAGGDGLHWPSGAECHSDSSGRMPGCSKTRLAKPGRGKVRLDATSMTANSFCAVPDNQAREGETGEALYLYRGRQTVSALGGRRGQ